MLIALAFAFAAPEIERQDLPAEPLAKRLKPDDAWLSIVYGGEQRGEVGACACSVRPTGGLDRFASYIEASKALTPTLAVHVGAAFAKQAKAPGKLDAASTAKNEWVAKALSLTPLDAINVGSRDVNGVLMHPTAAPWVSASLTLPGVEPVRWVEHGGKRIAVTGVTGRGNELSWPADTAYTPPRAALDQLDLESADLVVVLATGMPKGVHLADHPKVDVYIEGDHFLARWEAHTSEGALWARSWEQTRRVGDLRFLGEPGATDQVIDRQTDLDGTISTTKALRKLVRDSERR